MSDIVIIIYKINYLTLQILVFLMFFKIIFPIKIYKYLISAIKKIIRDEDHSIKEENRRATSKLDRSTIRKGNDISVYTL